MCGDYTIDLFKIKTKNHFNDYFHELVINGFFLKTTLPTRINHLSDHQIIFTYIKKLSYIEKVPIFITIEKNNAASVQNFIREMETLIVYDELSKSIDSNREHNYEVLLKSIKNVKGKCLPKKVVNYNKKKRKKSKWMISALLKSINIKNQLYKKVD